jgi:hypothetical protein
MQLDVDRLVRFPDDRSRSLVIAEELAHNLLFAISKPSHTTPRPVNKADWGAWNQAREEDARAVLREWGYTDEEYEGLFKRLEEMGLCKP